MKTKPKKPTKIIIAEFSDGTKDYAVAKDTMNWIWMIKSSDMETYGDNRGYYTSFEAFFKRVLNLKFREFLTDFDTRTITKSLHQATEFCTELGKELDKVNWGALDRGAYCPKCNSTIKYPKSKEA
jgi:hypothetical protein